MASKVNFLDKVLARIDRLDRQSVQNYVASLVQERKRTEQALNEIDEGILIVDREGIVQYANRRAFLWLGFERFLKDRSTIKDLVKEPAVREFLLDCLKRPEESQGVTLEVLLPREMSLRIHWTPLEEEAGREILIRIENVTPQTDRDEEEAQAKRIQGLVRLAAGVAHEIGNPLNSIQIHLELLKQEIKSLPERKQKSFDRLIGVVSSETRRLDQIVRSFLKATRRPSLRFRKESVNEVLEEAVDFLRPEMDKRKIQLRFSLDKNLPSFLLDRDRLHQAFINLIKNAMEAMPRGGRFFLSTASKDRLCLVRFQDEGEGIDERDLPHIFEAYYTTKEEGSGLGLSQVYEAVREHGGRIDVKSQLGKGSVFTLALPIRQERLSLPEPQAGSLKRGVLS